MSLTSPSCPCFWLWLHGLFVDTYAGSIVSWACSLHHDTELVLYALCRACTYEHIRDTPFGAGPSITRTRDRPTRLFASANRCCLGALSPRLARLEMHLATHLPRQPSGCIRPSASGRAPRFAPGRLQHWLTSRRSPRHGSTGTTQSASCTASGGVLQRRQKQSTTLNKRARSSWFTHNEVCTKPGAIQMRIGLIRWLSQFQQIRMRANTKGTQNFSHMNPSALTNRDCDVLFSISTYPPYPS